MKRLNQILLILSMIFFILSCNSQKGLYKNFKNVNGICIKIGSDYLFYSLKEKTNDFFTTEKVSKNNNDTLDFNGGVNIYLGVDNYFDSVRNNCEEEIKLDWGKAKVPDVFKSIYISYLTIDSKYYPNKIESLKENERKLQSHIVKIEGRVYRFNYYSPHHLITKVQCWKN